MAARQCFPRTPGQPGWDVQKVESGVALMCTWVREGLGRQAPRSPAVPENLGNAGGFYRSG